MSRAPGGKKPPRLAPAAASIPSGAVVLKPRVSPDMLAVLNQTTALARASIAPGIAPPDVARRGHVALLL